MADFVNPVTTEIVLSQSAMPSPWVTCTRANAEAWLAIVQKYRKWVTDHIEEMTAGEKTTVDANLLTAARDAAASQLQDLENIQRAFMLQVLDEFNLHAVKINAILTAIDNGSTVAQIKTNIAAIADYPARTEAQLRTAIRNKLGL